MTYYIGNGLWMKGQGEGKREIEGVNEKKEKLITGKEKRRGREK